MKTFLDLKIGDIVYKVETASYKSREAPQLTEVKVIQLEIEKKRFMVNKYYGYSSYSYLIDESIDKLECDILIYKDHFLTINKDYLNKCLKAAGMDAIKYHQNEIKKSEKNIENVRKAYSEYLNYR